MDLVNREQVDLLVVYRVLSSRSIIGREMANINTRRCRGYVVCTSL